MVEETDTKGDGLVDIYTPVFPRQHVGRRGADVATDQTLLHKGDVLTPSRVGALAAMGLTDVEVYDQPKVALLSTGNEIVDPGQALGPGQIYDINRFTLASVVTRHGGLPSSFPVASDSLEALGSAVDSILEQETDILVFSGGSSVGEHDLTTDILREKGEIFFHGIAVKPGKPTVFGQIAKTFNIDLSLLSRNHIENQPGNPASVCRTATSDNRPIGI